MFKEFQTYVPRVLGGLVDVIAEAHTERSLKKAWIMPGGGVEIAFFLDGATIESFFMGDDAPAERGSRSSFSLLFGASTKPQVVVAPESRCVIVMMAPIAARLIFGIPASEIHNRTVEPTMIQRDLAMIEDRLNAKASFNERAKFLEGYFLERLRGQMDGPPFVSLARHAQQVLLGADPFWLSRALIDRTGYSAVHVNRLSKEWLGTTVDRYEALFRFRKALTLMQADDVSMAAVAATAGYHDQAHFTNRFKQYSGLTPSEYLLAPKAGMDTLILDGLPG